MPASVARRWPGYATIWRWHFYAGLICIPFVLWLAVTGSLYLFRPQVEAFLDRPYAHLADARPAASPSAQAEAAVAAVPGSALHRYQLPESPDAATQILVGTADEETRVYLHPRTLAVLKTVDEDGRLMPTIARLHGELLIGTPGSYLVELAASWAIIMVLSGLFLWWPRGQGVGGVLYPRLSLGGRRFWRDLHGVTGFWVSFFALFLLLTGLPWAKSWGSYLGAVRTLAEPAAPKPDWSTGHADALEARAASDAATRAMLGDHVEHGGMAMEHPTSSYAALDSIVPAVRPLNLAPPVMVAPPTGHGTPWTVKSDSANRPLRTTLTLSEDGTVLSREDFTQRPLVDRIVGYGVAAHEGQLFGLLNQLIGLATALGLILLAISSVVLWWRRRPDGVLGAPPRRISAPLSVAFLATLVGLAVLLPLMGVTMLAVLLAERLIARSAPTTARWLGLAAPG